MRRLTLMLAAVMAVFGLAAAAHAKKFAACPGGRFVVTPSDALLAGGAVTIGQGQAVLSACGATSAKLHGTKKFTTVVARWAHCGSFSKVLLKAKVPSPACGSLQGTIKAKKVHVRSFTGALSTCGDGFLDADGGESCDASASGGDAGCPGACLPAGTPGACACGGTTLSTTTTTLPVSATCGNRTVDAGETCDDGNTLDGDDCPSTCFVGGCTPIPGTSRMASVTYVPPPGQTVGGLGLFVDYPESQVRHPMIRVSSGVSGVVHDRDYGLTEELIDATGTGLPGTLFMMQFSDCQGATPPTAADFRCTVEDASDESGNVLDPATISCAVTVP